MKLAMLVLCSLLWAAPALAVDTELAFSDPQLQQRYESLNRELRCLVCQNQAIADSNAGLAADLRREVHALLTAGKSDAEIREFMTDRYGDFVLYNPPVTGRTYLLWAAPAILLAIGLLTAFLIIRRRSRAVDSDPDEVDEVRQS